MNRFTIIKQGDSNQCWRIMRCADRATLVMPDGPLTPFARRGFDSADLAQRVLDEFLNGPCFGYHWEIDGQPVWVEPVGDPTAEAWAEQMGQSPD